MEIKVTYQYNNVFNRIYQMLDKRSLAAYFNGLVLPHLDYADIVWGDQQGLTAQMKQLQSFQNRFAKKIVKANMTSAEALTLLWWAPLHGGVSVIDSLKGEIPEHLDVFNSTMSQQHGYNTRNDYMPIVVNRYMSPLISDEDENFGGSLVSDFRK